MFNLPQLELLVQDFHAGLWRGIPYGWWQGRLIITSNHVLFRATVGSFVRDIKIRHIKSCESAKTLLLVDNGLEIRNTNGDLISLGIPTPGHRDEALVLIRHLMHHSVTLVDQQVMQSEAIDREMSGNAPKALNHHLRVSEAPILLKSANDSLGFARLIFRESSFVVVNQKEQIVADYQYEDISSVVIRARPLHLDVKFQVFPRLRLCSAEIQTVVVELHARAEKAKIIFENGPMPRFLYDMPRHELMPRISRERIASMKSFRDVQNETNWRYSVKVTKEEQDEN